MKIQVTILALFISLVFMPNFSYGQAPDSNSTIPEWLQYIYEPIDTCDNIGTGLLIPPSY